MKTRGKTKRSRREKRREEAGGKAPEIAASPVPRGNGRLLSGLLLVALACLVALVLYGLEGVKAAL